MASSEAEVFVFLDACYEFGDPEFILWPAERVAEEIELLGSPAELLPHVRKWQESRLHQGGG